MVEIDKLVKQYGDFCLDISLEIPDGVITGVIGKNGAGKSTLIKSILGLIKPTSGSVKVFDKDVESLMQSDKCDIGVALAESGFSMYLSAKDIAGILGKMYPRFKEDFFFEKCKQLGLPMGKQIKDYSTGMKAKLRVLVAILDPNSSINFLSFFIALISLHYFVIRLSVYTGLNLCVFEKYGLLNSNPFMQSKIEDFATDFIEEMSSVAAFSSLLALLLTPRLLTESSCIFVSTDDS